MLIKILSIAFVQVMLFANMNIPFQKNKTFNAVVDEDYIFYFNKDKAKDTLQLKYKNCTLYDDIQVEDYAENLINMLVKTNITSALCKRDNGIIIDKFDLFASEEWNQFTLANIKEVDDSYELFIPKGKEISLKVSYISQSLNLIDGNIKLEYRLF